MRLGRKDVAIPFGLESQKPKKTSDEARASRCSWVAGTRPAMTTCGWVLAINEKGAALASGPFR